MKISKHLAGDNFVAAPVVTEFSGDPVWVPDVGGDGAHPLVTGVSWTNTGGGDWGLASNWSDDAVPNGSNSVTIAAAGSYTVTISQAEAANSLTIDNSGVTVSDTASFSLGTTLALTAGVFSLGGGGDVVGGTIAVGTNGDFQGTGGTLSNVAARGSVSIDSDNSSLTLTNGVTFGGAGGSRAGTINLGGYDNQAYLCILLKQ